MSHLSAQLRFDEVANRFRQILSSSVLLLRNIRHTDKTPLTRTFDLLICLLKSHAYQGRPPHHTIIYCSSNESTTS